MNKVQLVALMLRAVPQPPPTHIIHTGPTGIEFEWFGHRFVVDPDCNVTENGTSLVPNGPRARLMTQCFKLAMSPRQRKAPK